VQAHVHSYTHRLARCYPEEWQGYGGSKRAHFTVCHGVKEWARDDDGEGIREVHTNTIEGWWTAVRNFLRPFRGVHQKYLNRGRIAPRGAARAQGPRSAARRVPLSGWTAQSPAAGGR
jgi:hypothetical protein